MVLVDLALPAGGGRALSFGDDPSDARIQRGGGVVVVQVSLASSVCEEATDIVAMLGEVGEPFGEDGCVGVSTSDDLRNRLEPCGSLSSSVFTRRVGRG